MTMKIDAIHSHGLQKGDFEHKLTGVDIFVGPNWSGKTSRLKAIRLAIEGHLSELGNKPSLTAALMRGSGMSVEVALSNGKFISRKWQEVKGSIEFTTAGAELEVSPVLLDPMKYFGLGDKDRMRYVFERCKVDMLDGQPVADVIITKIKSIKVEEHTPDHEAAIRDACNGIDASDRDRNDAGQSIQDWIESLVSTAREESRTRKANVKTMRETVKGLAEVRGEDDAEMAKNLEKQVKAADDKLAEANRKATLVCDKYAEARRTNRERQDLEAKLTGLVDNTAKIEHLSSWLITAQDEAASYTGGELLESHKAMQAEIERLSKELKEYKSATNEAYDNLRAAESWATSVDTKLKSAEDDRAQMRDDHALDMQAEACPHCEAKSKGWKKRIEARYIETDKLRESEIIGLKTELVKASNHAETLKKALETCKQSDQENQSDWQAVRDMMKDAESIFGQISKRRAELNLAASNLNTQIDNLQAAQSRATEIKAQAAKLPPMIPVEEMNVMDDASDKATKECTTAVNELSELRKRQEAFIRKQQDDKRNAQTLQKLTKLEAGLDVSKEVLDILESLQLTIVKQAFGTLIERANKLAGGIMHAPLEYRDGEIGYVQGQSWVGWKTLSGAEKVLVYTGISLALAWESPIKIIMLDEMNGPLEELNLTLYLQKMVQLVKDGVIDQFVGTASSLGKFSGNVAGTNVIGVTSE